METRQVSIDRQGSTEDVQYVRSKLAEYNLSHTTEQFQTLYEDVNVILRDDDGTILGGITGSVKWNFFKIGFFWTDEKVRGLGYGKTMLRTIEEMAKEKGCDLVEVDTFSFQAPEFYQKAGYEVAGIVPNAPRGFSHYYLFKRLD